MARLRRPLSILAPLIIAGALLSSCGVGGAVIEARTSCRYVHKALLIQAQSNEPGLSVSRRATLRANALAELLKGTQSAANATSMDGSWNALQTTINEAERVPLSDVVASLARICQVADSTSPYLN
ncbi:MAG: hypothetical protein ABSG09_04505 [Acidimicrobiales bacterium]